MNRVFKSILSFLILFISIYVPAQKKTAFNAIYSGIPWFDNRGMVVSAHGACIIKDRDLYYLFGESHTDTSNAFAGFNCYSSADLYNWKFESLALPVQESGRLGPNRVGERVKVMKCPQTGEYVMYMHADTLGYTDQCVGYATAATITGPYTFKGALLFNGKPVRKWDMGSFQDADGSGYILLHGADIYKLNNDYKSIGAQVNKAFEKGFESPAIFRKDSLYYFLGSDLSGWERNDNYYFTSTSLKGPWKRRGFFAPRGTLTWNSQTTFVLPVHGSKESTYIFMGDRWSFPKQASAATYIWQPFTVSGLSISIPEYKEAWTIDLPTGTVSALTIRGNAIVASDKQLVYSGNWQQDTLDVKSSDEKDAGCSFTTKATQIGIYALARPNGGYAGITIRNSKGKIILRSTVDMYSKYPAVLLKFLSPVLKKDKYTITVTVLGEHWYWKEKSGRLSGSKGNFVSVDSIVIN